MTLEYEAKDPAEIGKFIQERSGDWKIIKQRKRESYYNIAAGFDIETSSWFRDKEGGIYKEQNEENTRTKEGCLVSWQFGIDGSVFVGRDWESLEVFMQEVSEGLQLSEDLRLPVYVHNLAYEFGWICRRINISEGGLFATDSRKPVKVKTVDGFEFRDSLILTQASLEKVGKDLTKYKVDKKVGDWDYSKIRHGKTPLTDEEIGYAISDVLVVMAKIQECIDEEGRVDKIPLTKTGYVRRRYKKATIEGENAKKYKRKMSGLTITTDEYDALKKAFQGGITHANIYHVGETVENVGSFDFTSSYPAQMVMQEYPMGLKLYTENVDKKRFAYYMKNNCCMFEVTYYNIESKVKQERILSFSKCEKVKGVDFEGGIGSMGKFQAIDNGKILHADELTTTITEQDFYNIRDFYDYEDFKINKLWVYNKQFLPSEFVDVLLQLYEGKTTLKDVPEKLVEYMASKGMINASFGMTVTDPLNIEHLFDATREDPWYDEKPDKEEAIREYNESQSRFLYYPWGVWCTAYSRRALCKGILAAGDNYLYADTDSIKYKIEGSGKFLQYITEYNRNVDKKMREAMKHHGFDFSRTRPKTIKGVEKPLGYWDDDGHYLKFKTLGAKRYAYTVENKKTRNVEFHTTIAGSNKSRTAKYIAENFADPFEGFEIGLVIPKEYSGRLIHEYIDHEMSGSVTDYLGNVSSFEERSIVHLSESEFTMKISDDFDNLLHNLDDTYICNVYGSF